MNNKTMVTVICITYNQEKFIRDAIEGFVMQKTSFPYKIFIGDDCSKDATPDIIREYAEKYPDIIVPFIREKNMGAQRNLIDLCNRAESPYLAFCEGDDYWIDELKLQKQFDFMEENKNCNVCFHDARISIETDDETWFQSEQYKDEETEEYIYPRGLKKFDDSNTFFELKDFIDLGFIQTSSIFYRWNYSLEIPEWYYNHILGDYTLTAMQLGGGEIGYISEIMSVYRKHQSGVYYFRDFDEYFLKTRNDWVRLLKDLKDYFKSVDNVDGEEAVAQRINREVFNCFRILLKYNYTDELMEFAKENTEETVDILKWTIGEHQQLTRLRNRLTKGTVNKVLNDAAYGKMLKAEAKKMAKKKNSKSRFDTRMRYWGYALLPKKKNLWAFTSFKSDGYLDNTKYLYEYINAHHPEIEAVWFTKNKALIEELEEKGLPVCKMNTPEGKKLLSRAELAFTDHFVMSDYKNSGINAKTKIVQLWHGVGLKDLNGFTQTDVKGVCHSDDILAVKGDSIITRFIKLIKRFIRAPFREMCEKYFLLLGPGQEPVETLAETNRVPEKNRFICGYPRNELLYSENDYPKYRILYAPTYRWSAEKEKELVKSFLDYVPSLNKFLEENDAEFVIRLHPHTWRNHESRILAVVKDYPRITVDEEKDIYQTLNTYSLIVSDYSSIVYDFLLMDKPSVYYCPDYDYYINNEGNFKYPFDEYTPGPKTSTWEDTVKEIKAYMENPKKDEEFRKRVYDFFYDDSVNDADNSERIVNELKRRIKF